MASSAVVQDTSRDDSQRRIASDFALCSPVKFPFFKTVAVGLLPGRQTTGRAELYALLIALHAAGKLDNSISCTFISDASYVVLVVQKIILGQVEKVAGKESPEVAEASEAG